MIHKVVINTNQDKSLICGYIDRLGTDKVYQVVISEHKNSRSQAQSGLRWMWVDDISKFTGETKEEVNFRLKKDLLLPLFERNAKGEYPATMETLRNLYQLGMKDQALFLHRQVVDKTRTEEADIEEMAEYLTDIERRCISNRIALRMPGDYQLAIYGRKRHERTRKMVG